MKKILILTLTLMGVLSANAAAINQKIWDNPDTIVVARDGSGQFRNINEAIDVCRAFMDYHKVIFVKKGTYKEKLIVPSYVENIEICGESRDETIITYDDHANITDPSIPNNHRIGTFGSYTLKIEGNNIKLKNITVENNAPLIGQAVALHTEGDKLIFVNCRFLGNQDTVYTGTAGTRLYFCDCYIEGTTDFIFGPSIAWFENCEIKNKSNSYCTASSTPEGQPYGYVFNNCRITCFDGVDKCYLGRPWRPYAYTLFMNCEIGKHIRPEGWHNWGKESNEKTARYIEYNNHGEGADLSKRCAWSKQLTKKEVAKITPATVFSISSSWDPVK
ncbi:MAG: pectin esterase [Prevotella sp.]|nr:pectin esterase [Prevotella sp.]